MERDIKPERSAKKTLSSLLAVAVVIGASILLRFNYFDALLSYPKALRWILSSFYPTAESLIRLPNILSKLWQTILMAIASSTVAGAFAFASALLGAKGMRFRAPLSALSRTIASVFRNVPDIVWSMIFLFSFGQGMLTGFLALFFVTWGTLTRAFIESIDETSASSLEAMEAAGATRLQIVGQCILPESISRIISWLLYAIENNIRSATLIGILTGSGIGYIFDLYYKRMDYHTCALIVSVLVAVVLAVEGLSNKIRREVQ